MIGVENSTMSNMTDSGQKENSIFTINEEEVNISNMSGDGNHTNTTE